jgi:hypothetical protein
MRDKLLHQSVNQIKLLLQLRGSRQLHIKLLPDDAELIIDNRENVGRAHSGAGWPCRATCAPAPA